MHGKQDTARMDTMLFSQSVSDKLIPAMCPSCATYLEELELLHFTNKICGCNYLSGTFLATICCARSPLKMLQAKVDQYE